MSQHILKKPAIDLGAFEAEIQHRLRRGKAKLLVANIFCFILAAAFILFVI